MKLSLASRCAAALAAAALLIAPLPARAQERCYFETSRQALGHGRHYGCRITTRRNGNGDKVVDVAWHDGQLSSYILWPSGTAEIFSGNRRYLGRWKYSDGVGLIILHDSNAVTILASEL